MGNLVRLGAVCFALLLMAAPALAQEKGAGGAAPAAAAAPAGALGGIKTAAIGAGMVILGAAFGIGRIGGQAVEGMSRQPEAAGNIQTAMIISAALIEGATFFALIVCMLFNNN